MNCIPFFLTLFAGDITFYETAAEAIRGALPGCVQKSTSGVGNNCLLAAVLMSMLPTSCWTTVSPRSANLRSAVRAMAAVLADDKDRARGALRHLRKRYALYLDQQALCVAAKFSLG